MDKISIEATIKEAYKIIDHSTINIKSVFLGLCADIERFFRLKLNIDVHQPLLIDSFSRLIDSYPLLKDMTIDQLNRLIIVFINIRNSNAHLHVNKNVFLDNDLISYFEAIAKPQFKVSIDTKITIYGSLYILIFLSQKYLIWNTCSLLLRSNLFLEIEKKNMVNFQTETNSYFSQFCGNGKPLYTAAVEPFGKISSQYFTDLNKRHLTELFFNLELGLYNSNKAEYQSLSFSTILYKENRFKNEQHLAAEILKLRNLWFHGTWLFDEVSVNEETILFDFDYIFNILLKIKNFLIYSSNFKPVVEVIHNYGLAVFHFFCLRLVEVSYKLLDNRLLTIEKIDSRAIDSLNAYNRLLNVDSNIFIKAGKLLLTKEIKWKIAASKLSDVRPRKTVSECLKVYHLHSETGFDIGEYHTDAKEIAVVKIDILDEFQNKINGKFLNEFVSNKTIKISDFIEILNVN